MDVESVLWKIQALQKECRPFVLPRQHEPGNAYQDRGAAERDTTRTGSGIDITPVKAGTGASPSATDAVSVHHEGRVIDCTVFDRSIRLNEPGTFTLKHLAPLLD